MNGLINSNAVPFRGVILIVFKFRNGVVVLVLLIDFGYRWRAGRMSRSSFNILASASHILP